MMGGPEYEHIHATDRGDGTPLVFLHGAWLSSDMWAPQVDAFAPEYRVVVPDAPGHGRTRTKSRRFSIDRYADDLNSFLTDRGIDRPVICGLSLGGLVAQRYAERYPVRGVVLANTTRTVPPIPLSETIRCVPMEPLYATMRCWGARASFEWLLAGVEGPLGRRWLAVRDEPREYALDEVTALSGGEFVAVLDALHGYDPCGLHGDDLNAQAMLVNGDAEAPPVVAQTRSLASRLGADRLSIPDAGHLVNRDNQAAFNDAIAGFLTEIGA